MSHPSPPHKGEEEPVSLPLWREIGGAGDSGDYGFGMPTVSGETLALPLLNSIQALACTAGKTAFCAASPDSGSTGHRGWRHISSASHVGDVVRPDLLDRLDHLVRHALGNEDAEIIARIGKAGKRCGERRNRAVTFDFQGLVADAAKGRSLFPRIMSACSTADWVVTSVSPATVATTAGLPPS